MKRRMNIGSILACLLIILAASVKTPAARGQSPTSPAPMGVSVKSEIHCGDKAASLESYDATITILQALRGKEAWERLRAASSSNKPPPSGFEYILARIRFELKARGAPADKSFDLGSPLQFTALSAEGKDYAAPSAVLPQPELSGTLRSGDSAEGWIAFLVDQGESRPILAFDPSSGGAMLRGRALFFQLYR